MKKEEVKLRIAEQKKKIFEKHYNRMKEKMEKLDKEIKELKGGN